MPYIKFDGSLAAETPAATSSLYGTNAGGETLTGGTGADALWGQGAGDLLVGGGGGDTFYMQGSGTRIQEIAGGVANQIVSWSNTSLGDYANVRNLVVGGDGTYAAGDAQDNILVTNGSRQQLYGGAGQDVLIGSGTTDTFIIVKGEGNDAIYGFNTAADVIRLTSGYSTFAQVQSHMTQVGADVKIDLGGTDGVVIRNVATSQLTAANFQLQLDPSKLGAQTFGDEFNSLSLYKSGAGGTWSTTWWYDNPNGNGGTLASNNEQQWYINANYAPTAEVKPWVAANGVLTITAAPASPQISSLINGYKYTSGEINTQPTFAQTYGYFEMRADLPSTAGGWPAFWLLPADGSWPPELDVMEVLTKDDNFTYVTSHSTATGAHTMSQGVALTPDTADGYHTYGVLWTKTDLTWFVDGTEVFRTATPADMNKPMYMIANLALGGWGGALDSSQLPAALKIDYIRAYALADGSSTVVSTLPPLSPPPPPPPPSPPPPPPPPPAGVVLTASKNGVAVGGAGADTINAAVTGGCTMTGGAGADVFSFSKLPPRMGHITDFAPGVDRLDISKLLTGYKGTDPVADKYVSFISDGAGGTKVMVDIDGAGRAYKPTALVDLDKVAPSGLTSAKVFGLSAPTSSPLAAPTEPLTSAKLTVAAPEPIAPAAPSGLTLTSTAVGTVLTGGAGADTLSASMGLDTLTGGAGADHFVFGKEPWAPIHITDFQVGTDVLDLSALFKLAGYTGSDPVADRYIYFESDGHGGTMVRFDRDAGGPAPVWPNTIIDLEHVSPTGLTWSQLQGGWIAP